MYFRFFLYFLNKLFPSFLYIPLYFCVWLGWGLFTSQGVYLYCCILNLLYFWFFVFLYIDRVTRQERSLFTSQDVIFPQPRCTQSCSPFSWKYKYIQPFKSNHLDIQRVSYAGHNQCQLWGCILTQPRMSTFSLGFANQMENTGLLGNLINWSNLNAKHNSTNLRPIILWPFEGHHCHCCIRSLASRVKNHFQL